MKEKPGWSMIFFQDILRYFPFAVRYVASKKPALGIKKSDDPGI